MTARELRLHLAKEHDIPTRGLTFDDMAVLHDYEHRPGLEHDHRHEDRTNAL